MLDARGVSYRYREYRVDRLDEREIRSLLKMLGLRPHDVLRRNDKAFKAAGLTGNEDAKTLVGLMAEHPTLLQRPIGVYRGRAVVGRPPEALLELVKASRQG